MVGIAAQPFRMAGPDGAGSAGMFPICCWRSPTGRSVPDLAARQRRRDEEAVERPRCALLRPGLRRSLDPSRLAAARAGSGRPSRPACQHRAELGSAHPSRRDCLLSRAGRGWPPLIPYCAHAVRLKPPGWMREQSDRSPHRFRGDWSMRSLMGFPISSRIRAHGLYAWPGPVAVALAGVPGRCCRSPC